MIEIMNLKTDKPKYAYDFIIDRTKPVGNPYVITDNYTRDRVCNLYEYWFKDEVEKQNRMSRLIDRMIEIYKTHGKLRLFCWCAPKRCHGETIKKYIEENLQ